MLQPHAFFILKFEICHEESKRPGDPECSSDEEIDKYLKGKTVRVVLIEKKLDLVEQQTEFLHIENYMQTIKLDRNKFFDIGWRYKK